jgi:hypothetical protein
MPEFSTFSPVCQQRGTAAAPSIHRLLLAAPAVFITQGEIEQKVSTFWPGNLGQLDVPSFPVPDAVSRGASAITDYPALERVRMKRFNQLSSLGALILAASLIGYAVYELVLYPNAGFPTSDFSVIVSGADTLRVGHWLKFGYAISLAMLVVGLYPRLQDDAPVLARLAGLAGISSIVLFLASGRLGLRILNVAEATYATNPSEATTTILLRTVTFALFEVATFAAGWYALLISLAGVQTGRLPRPLSWVGGGTWGIIYCGHLLTGCVETRGTAGLDCLGGVAGVHPLA